MHRSRHGAASGQLPCSRRIDVLERVPITSKQQPCRSRVRNIAVSRARRAADHVPICYTAEDFFPSIVDS